MNVTPLFYGRVSSDGKAIAFDNALGFARVRHGLRGQQVEVTLRKRRTQRSLKQNAAYWALIVPAVAEYCGYTKDEAHEALAWRFLQEGEPDAKLPKRRSTATLNVQEFQEYADTCKRFAAEELGIFIPDPGQVDL